MNKFRIIPISKNPKSKSTKQQFTLSLLQKRARVDNGSRIGRRVWCVGGNSRVHRRVSWDSSWIGSISWSSRIGSNSWQSCSAISGGEWSYNTSRGGSNEESQANQELKNDKRILYWNHFWDILAHHQLLTFILFLVFF